MKSFILLTVFRTPQHLVQNPVCITEGRIQICICTKIEDPDP